MPMNAASDCLKINLNLTNFEYVLNRGQSQIEAAPDRPFFFVISHRRYFDYLIWLYSNHEIEKRSFRVHIANYYTWKVLKKGHVLQDLFLFDLFKKIASEVF